ncbi:hypothetical protein [Sodalis praecaptivus]
MNTHCSIRQVAQNYREGQNAKDQAKFRCRVCQRVFQPTCPNAVPSRAL